MYELAGPVAKKHGIEGKTTKNFEVLLGAFTNKKALFEQSMPPDAEEHVKNKIKERQEKICKQACKLPFGVCMPAEAAYLENALDHLAAQYICNSFSAKYDEISPELFALERIIEAKSDDGHHTAQVNIPLFASAPMIGNKEWKITKEWNQKDSYTTYKATITSNMPPIAREAKEKAKQAGADFLETYSNALKEPVLGDWMMRKGISCSLEMKLYWIPSPKDLKIKLEVRERDPMIIAQLYDKHFLVAKWNVEGEEPFEHYLAEYKVR